MTDIIASEMARLQLKYGSNPYARELVTYKIIGVPPASDLRRFVVAVRFDGKLLRLPTSYTSKAEAVKVCTIMSELF